MANGYTWAKFSLSERYNYGVFIVVSGLVAVVIYLNHRNEVLQDKQDIKINYAVRQAVRPLIDQLNKKDLDIVSWQTKYFNLLESTSVTDSIWKATYKKLKDEKK